MIDVVADAADGPEFPAVNQWIGALGIERDVECVAEAPAKSVAIVCVTTERRT